jgi:FkbM family methyltransferase
MTSQAGQDYWIYGESFNEKRCGYFLDIGAYDGIFLSNTYILESKYNWSGICIEANPITFEKLKNNRCAINLNFCLDRSEGKVNFILRDIMGGIVDRDVDNKEADTKSYKVIQLKTTSLNRLLEDQNAPSVIDYLSIDIEGAEERVLSGFDFSKYTFRCITIERPTELLRDLFKDQGYILIREIPGLDCFYVHHTFLKDYTKNLISVHPEIRGYSRFYVIATQANVY